MKRWNLFKDLPLKIGALIFAGLLWLVVMNVYDPVVDSAPFRDIPVTVLNEEIVTNYGKVYQILDETETITVTVRARRSVLSGITSGDIVATADFNQMQFDSLVPITVTVEGYEGQIESATAMPANLQIQLDDIMRNTFPLTVNITGTPREGYVIGETTTNPNTVTIRGPEALVSSISRAVARVDVSGISSTVELPAELVLYDEDGDVLSQSTLSNNLGDQGLMVAIQVLNTKNVRLSFSTYGEVTEGYVLSELSSEPTTILVAGTNEDLRWLTEIVIPPEAIDITTITGREELSIDIRPFLPEGITLVDENANYVVVSIFVEQLGRRTIELPVEAIRIVGLADDLSLSYGEISDIELQFIGTAEDLEDLDISYAVYIDLRNMIRPGEHSVVLQVELTSNVRLARAPTITVILTEKEDE